MQGLPLKLVSVIWMLLPSLVPSLVPSLAYAHRGFGPAELGPPIWTAVGVAVVCYWVMVLWPESKKKGSSASGRVNKNNEDDI